MPRIKRFPTCEVALYFADHPPPHFHVLGADGQAQIRIDTLEVIDVSGRVDLREALRWAEENRPILEAKWEEFSGDER